MHVKWPKVGGHYLWDTRNGCFVSTDSAAAFTSGQTAETQNDEYTGSPATEYHLLVADQYQIPTDSGWHVNTFLLRDIWSAAKPKQ